MATIICDFDDVLFNTASFKQPFFQFLELLSGKNPQPSYEKAKNKGRYNTLRHMALLANGNIDTAETFKQKTRTWVQQSALPYLFEDTCPFLQQLLEKGHTICLLTKGTAWFQRAKIRGCGINVLVRGIYIAEEVTKAAACTRLMRAHRGPFILLEDTPSEIERLKRAFPTLTAIHVTRGMDLSIEPSADYRIANLNEALGIIASRF